MISKVRKIFLSFATCTIVFFISCASNNKFPQKQNDELTLVFAGDIMAHENNFKMSDYDLIWEDISPILNASDLSFANLESPVNDNIPFETYPTFNMNSSYPEAAIKAGINVLSLSNNHTNDQGLEGIRSTSLWAMKKEEETKGSKRALYFSGLKENGNISYRTINIRSWKILYVAITQSLNQPSFASYINYVKNTERAQNAFVKEIKDLREANDCDLFIISIHSNETEYVAKVEDSVEKFYLSLINSGVDIITANHPHVIRQIDFLGEDKSNKINKMIIYGNGNVISSQRRKPTFSNPENKWDNTGDGSLVKITCDKINNKPYIKDSNIFYITTYIDKNRNFIIKQLNKDFYEQLRNNNQNEWADYLEKREIINKKIEGKTIWQ